MANLGGGGTAFTNLGPVGGAGSVVKAGTVTTALVGTNSFTGNITVNAGRLILGPPLTGVYPAPVVTVASGATLDVMPISGGLTLANNAILQGSGTVTGSVVVPTGATLLPGSDGVAGTMLITNGSVSFLHQSFLRYDLSITNNAPGGGTNDLLVVNGSLSLTNTNYVSFNFLGSNAPLFSV